MLPKCCSPRRTIVRLLALFLLFIGAASSVIATQVNPVTEGETIFNQKCVGCHTIGGGVLVGPDLKNVSASRDHQWLVNWIMDPPALVASGDETAIALTKEFPALVMPSLGLDESQANAVLAYIDSVTGNTDGAAATPAPILVGDITRGQELFTGRTSAGNGGPACIACHSVSGIGALGGGQLGPDLTLAVNKYGGETGLGAFLSNPPTQTMGVIWGPHPLTAQEQADLVAFLNQAAIAGRPTNSIVQLAALALLGAGILLLLAQIIWRHRLTGVRRPMVTGIGR